SCPPSTTAVRAGLAEPRESAGRHRAGCAGSAPDAAPVPAGWRGERALMSDFQPADSFRSPRFAQPATFMRLPQTRDYAQLDVALLGIPFDGGTSYRPGPRFGRREARAGRDGAHRLAPGHVGGVLRQQVLPRHAVPAGD